MYTPPEATVFLASETDLNSPAATAASVTRLPDATWANTLPPCPSATFNPSTDASKVSASTASRATSPRPNRASAASIALRAALSPRTKLVTSHAKVRCASRAPGFVPTSRSSRSISGLGRKVKNLRSLITSLSGWLYQN